MFVLLWHVIKMERKATVTQLFTIIYLLLLHNLKFFHLFLTFLQELRAEGYGTTTGHPEHFQKSRGRDPEDFKEQPAEDQTKGQWRGGGSSFQLVQIFSQSSSFSTSLSLSFAPTAGTTWWWTRLRTTWVRFASGGSGWRWRGGWVSFLPFYTNIKWLHLYDIFPECKQFECCSPN